MHPISEDRNVGQLASLRPALVRFFKTRCRNAAEAEDLAQDVVVRALAHADELSPGRESGYVFRIALNRWRDRGRRLVAQGNRVAWDEESVLKISDGFCPERIASGEQELERVVDVLLKLGERTRQALLLFRLEHMRQADIAKSMSISVSAVEKHLARAEAHLARHGSLQLVRYAGIST